MSAESVRTCVTPRVTSVWLPRPASRSRCDSFTRCCCSASDCFAIASSSPAEHASTYARTTSATTVMRARSPAALTASLSARAASTPRRSLPNRSSSYDTLMPTVPSLTTGSLFSSRYCSADSCARCTAASALPEKPPCSFATTSAARERARLAAATRRSVFDFSASRTSPSSTGSSYSCHQLPGTASRDTSAPFASSSAWFASGALTYACCGNL